MQRRSQTPAHRFLSPKVTTYQFMPQHVKIRNGVWIYKDLTVWGMNLYFTRSKTVYAIDGWGFAHGMSVSILRAWLFILMDVLVMRNIYRSKNTCTILIVSRNEDRALDKRFSSACI